MNEFERKAAGTVRMDEVVGLGVDPLLNVV